jgi:superfamily II DNA/RNA helicase
MNLPFIPGLCDELSLAMGELGFLNPTTIQKLAVPALLEKKDLFIQSETGTGKTFAYLIPAISFAMSLSPARGPLALIICPTQELTMQVAKHANILIKAAKLDMETLSLIGGSPLSRQESSLKHKPSIVVGTPGRIEDLLSMRSLRMDNLEFLILDEADRLFSKEYKDSVLEILKRTNSKTCKVLASATLLDSTKQHAMPFMNSPRSIMLEDEGVLTRDIEHWVFYVEHRKKIDFVRRLENALHPSKCLIFASTGERVTKAGSRLAELGLSADFLLSKQEKEYRRIAVERFEKGSLRYLVTSDLGARGLDIEGISHIIHLDFPDDGSWYVHRAGRTGRAGSKGISIVLADGWDLEKASKVAIARGFVFRTKVLSEGHVLEPEVEDFFSTVERGEQEKREFKRSRAKAARPDERRIGR